MADLQARVVEAGRASALYDDQAGAKSNHDSQWPEQTRCHRCNGEVKKMTDRRAPRCGTLLGVVLALVLAATLAACTEGEDRDSGSLLERADEREATQEAGSSGSQSQTPGLDIPGSTGEADQDRPILAGGEARPAGGQFASVSAGYSHTCGGEAGRLRGLLGR